LGWRNLRANGVPERPNAEPHVRCSLTPDSLVDDVARHSAGLVGEQLTACGLALDLEDFVFRLNLIHYFPISQPLGHLAENPKMDQSRRNMLTLGGAVLSMIPLAAFAARNDAMRTTMKYRDSPEGEKSCGNCVQFLPGKSPADNGGCRLFPDDTDVSPKAYCVAWAKRA